MTSLRSGGPAEEAKPKLAEDDIIVEVNGQPVNSVAELTALTTSLTAGQSAPVPALVAFDRRAERYLSVVKIGKEQLPDPDVEVHKAWLGVTTQVLTGDLADALKLDGRTGVRLTAVFPGSTAEKAGLKVGDVVTELDGDPIPASRPEQTDVFPSMIRQCRTGSQVELTLIRGTEEEKVKVALEQSPTSAEEMRRYREDSFDFTVRDLAFEDRLRNRFSKTQQGGYVEAVREGGWAALAHLAVGDLIWEVDGNPTPAASDVAAAMDHIAEVKPRLVVLHVRRGAHDLFVELQPKWSNEK